MNNRHSRKNNWWCDNQAKYHLGGGLQGVIGGRRLEHGSIVGSGRLVCRGVAGAVCRRIGDVVWQPTHLKRLQRTQRPVTVLLAPLTVLLVLLACLPGAAELSQRPRHYLPSAPWRATPQQASSLHNDFVLTLPVLQC